RPQPVSPPNGPLLQHRPRFDPEDQKETGPGVPLFHQHIIELAGLEERSDGALNVAVVDRLVNDQAGAADDLRGSEPLVALDHDTVDRGRRRILRDERRRAAEERAASEENPEKTAHQQGADGKRAGPPMEARRATLTPEC